MSDYVTFRDQAPALTLLDGVTYLVRTSQGREIKCRWDAGQQTFRRVSAMSHSGARNVVLPNPMVAAVCPVDRPRGHWVPFAHCVRSREKRVVVAKKPTPHSERGRAMRGEVAPAVYAVVTAGSGVSVDDVFPHCAPASRSTVMRVLRAAVKAGHMQGVRQSRHGVSAVLYTMTSAETVRPVSSTQRTDVYADGWEPATWTNPIAAGTASKVQAAPWATLDYSDPRRRVAA